MSNEKEKEIERSKKIKRVWKAAYQEWFYTLIKSNFTTRKRAGLWMQEDNSEQVYFTCPYCVKVNRVSRTSMCDTGFHDGHHSFFCRRCNRHLWLHFKGLKGE